MVKIDGVDITKFNERQLLAIEILAQPKRQGMKYEDVAEHVGIDVRTLYRWRHNPDFVEAVTKKAMMNLHEDLPEVFLANMKRAKNGEVRSVELLYRLLGLLVEKSEVEVKEEVKNNAAVQAEIEELQQRLGIKK